MVCCGTCENVILITGITVNNAEEFLKLMTDEDRDGIEPDFLEALQKWQVDGTMSLIYQESFENNSLVINRTKYDIFSNMDGNISREENHAVDIYVGKVIAHWNLACECYDSNHGAMVDVPHGLYEQLLADLTRAGISKSLRDCHIYRLVAYG